MSALGRRLPSSWKATPENYWQENAPEPGYASAAIFSDNGQAILGLPLMNGYLTIFDRSVD
jgi:hypothetical protein